MKQSEKRDFEIQFGTDCGRSRSSESARTLVGVRDRREGALVVTGYDL